MPDNVLVVTPGREPREIPRRELSAAVAAGAHLDSQEDIAKAEREAKYGGLGGLAAATAAGAARGTTFGLSDAAAAALGGEAARTYLRGVEEEHPIASTVSEFAGAIAPILATA